MIGIQVGTEFLDLNKETVIDLKLINPIFADDNIIPGSYSLPFTVPGGDVSPKNAALLGSPDVLSVSTAKKILDAKLYYDGVLYKRGKIKVGKVSGDTISINFSF